MSDEFNNENQGHETDYEVGYKRPPREHQFKKGQSGNPKGRRKKPKPIPRNFDTDVRNEFKEIVSVQVGGKPEQMTKQQAFIRKLFSEALSGKSASMKIVAYLLNKLPVKDSDMLLNEALKVIKDHCDKAKAKGTLPPEISDYSSVLLPIEPTKKDYWR